MRVNGKPVPADPGPDGYVVVTQRVEARRPSGHSGSSWSRAWSSVITRTKAKSLSSTGRWYWQRTKRYWGRRHTSLTAVSAAGTTVAALEVKPEPAPERLQVLARRRGVPRECHCPQTHRHLKAGAPLQVRLVPFADAGETGTSYKVWLPLGLAPVQRKRLARRPGNPLPQRQCGRLNY